MIHFSKADLQISRLETVIFLTLIGIFCATLSAELVKCQRDDESGVNFNNLRIALPGSGQQLRDSSQAYQLVPQRSLDDNQIDLNDGDDVDVDDEDENQIAQRRLADELGAPSSYRGISAEDIGALALARLAAARQAAAALASQIDLPARDIYLLEDKDYPKSLFEDASAQRVGQVSGLTTLPNDNEVVIFHRASRHWSADTFNETSKQIARDKQDELIKEDTIMIFDRDGSPLKSFGSNLFYMPHSIASDNQGNLWVSDVARHQVMRLPVMNIQRMQPTQGQSPAAPAAAATNSSGSTQVWPDIILGEAFVPGSDVNHFCKPSEIAVSSDGQLVYVADGYCNQRVMVFSGTTGKFVAALGQQDNMQVVHSLTLIEERNLLCVADRENQRILCYHAGLAGDLARLGELMHQVNYPIGRVFAISSISPDHLIVSSNQAGTSNYNLAVLQPFSRELKLVWTSSDLLEPHSLAATVDRQYAYAADVSKDSYKKLFKFHIIRR